MMYRKKDVKKKKSTSYLIIFFFRNPKPMELNVEIFVEVKKIHIQKYIIL